MRAEPQTVDAQCVIVSVLFRPLAMVYHSRSDGVQPEVRHAVSSYYHGALLFVERVYDGLQGMGVAVQVIAVKLYGEASAPGWLIARSQHPLCLDRYVGAEGGLPLCCPCIDR